MKIHIVCMKNRFPETVKFKRSLASVALLAILVTSLFGMLPIKEVRAEYSSFEVQLTGEYATYSVTIFYNTAFRRSPLIAFCPGNPTHKTDYYNFTARMANEGYIVAIPELYEFNGNITHEADALKAIINYAFSDTFPLKNRFHRGKVCAMGHSHGGDGIFKAGMEDGRILTLIPIATIQHELGDDVWQPTLLIAGQNDAVCPPERTIYVYNMIKVEKEYFVVAGSGHDVGVWYPSGTPNMTRQNTVVKYVKAWLNWFFYGDVNGPLDFFNNQNDGDNIANDPMVSSWASSYLLICNYELGTPYSGSMGPGWNTPHHGRPGYPQSRAELQSNKQYVFNGQKSANVTFEWDWAGASMANWPNPATVCIGTMFMFAWLPGDYVGSMLYTGTGSISITNRGSWWELSGPGGSVNLTALGLDPVAGEWIPIEICWLNDIDKVQVWWKNVKVIEGTWTGSSVATFYMGYSHYSEQHTYWYSQYWDRTIVSTTFINFTFAVPDQFEPTYEIEMHVNSPEETTYESGTIAVDFSVTTNGTLQSMWFNVKNGTQWVYASNRTYTGSTYITGFMNGTYTFYAWANLTEGFEIEKTVMFTVSISPVNRWQFTFNHKDLDGNTIDSAVIWQLYNGTQLLSYIEGRYSLLDGTYTLKTYFRGVLINQTTLYTETHGNKTININLPIKPHSAFSGGHIAFNHTITSLTINSQTATNLTFTATGSGVYTIIITGVPRNATSVKKNGVEQPYGSVWTWNPTTQSIIIQSSLSTWEIIIPESTGFPYGIIFTVILPVLIMISFASILTKRWKNGALDSVDLTIAFIIFVILFALAMGILTGG